MIPQVTSFPSKSPDWSCICSNSSQEKVEMRLWHFLSSWNGVSFFYKDFVSQPEDIQLFTDAAPSVSFYGYSRGKWFTSSRPLEFTCLLYSDSLSSIQTVQAIPHHYSCHSRAHEWSRKSILIHSENTPILEISNKAWSRPLAIIRFMRRLTLISNQYQVILWAAHIPSYHNSTADSLSCYSFQKFRCFAPESHPHPMQVPPFSAMTFN